MSRNNKKSFLIAQVEAPHRADGGDYYYRTHAPGIAMAKQEGIYVVNLTNVHRRKDQIMREADVLVLNSICDPDLLPLIMERKALGRLTVYEIGDDLTAIEPWNPVYFFFKNRENLALTYRLANCCDALQVSGSELKRLYGQLNDNCVIFPNHILNIPLERPVKIQKEIVLGWGGSQGHLQDMAEIAEPLINWLTTKPNVVLHLMCSESIWTLFDPLPQHKKRRTLPGSIDDYYNFLSRIDIGIAPLKDTFYNRSRSDVKFLEYAISGVVPVMSHVTPYINTVRNGETGFLFRSSNEFVNILNRLIEDGSLRIEIVQKARQYVLQERLQLQHGLDRVEFYRDLLRSLYGQTHRDSRGVQLFSEWAELEGAVRKGRHLRLYPTLFENMVHDGIVLHQVDGNKEKACLLFVEAMRLEPDNYLPYLLSAFSLNDSIKNLQKALSLNARSVRAWVWLGEQYVKQNDIKNALKCFDSAANIFPDYEIPYLRAASLLRSVGKKVEGDFLLNKAENLKRSIPSPHRM
ncbi:MAG: glycosyltransferase [Deltaproteobacteria bacterium]|nr:glycosyltransferase [Deltaproteobacteria bacterium]MBW2020269.1 glycosyltransferase [Deltaproteobacteria bacterium]MBW2073119.1 glycosyltransferase [Deltaproteobacteria bacterium]